MSTIGGRIGHTYLIRRLLRLRLRLARVGLDPIAHGRFLSRLLLLSEVPRLHVQLTGVELTKLFVPIDRDLSGGEACTVRGHGSREGFKDVSGVADRYPISRDERGAPEGQRTH